MARRDPLNPNANGHPPPVSRRDGTPRRVPAPPPIRRDGEVGALVEDFVPPPPLTEIPEFEPDKPDAEKLGTTTSSFRTDGGIVTTFPPQPPPGHGYPEPTAPLWQPGVETGAVLEPHPASQPQPRFQPEEQPPSIFADLPTPVRDSDRDRDRNSEVDRDRDFDRDRDPGRDLVAAPDPEDDPFWSVTTDLPASGLLTPAPAPAPDPGHVAGPTPRTQGPVPQLPTPVPRPAAPADRSISVDEALDGMDEAEAVSHARNGADRFDSDIELDALLAELSAVADDGRRDSGYQEPEYQQPEYLEPGYQEPEYQQPEYLQPGYQEPEYRQPGAYQDSRFRDPASGNGVDGIAPARAEQPPHRQAPMPDRFAPPRQPNPPVMAPKRQPPTTVIGNGRPNRDPRSASPGRRDRSAAVGSNYSVSPHSMNKPIIRAEDLGRDDRFDGLGSKVLKGLLLFIVALAVVAVALTLAS